MEFDESFIIIVEFENIKLAPLKITVSPLKDIVLFLIVDFLFISQIVKEYSPINIPRIRLSEIILFFIVNELVFET